MSEDIAAPFSLPIRVYYEDTDAGGIVYYVNYLKFMERARTEFLRQLGYEQRVMMEQCRMFVVADCQVNYKRPALLDDLLKVTAEVESVGKVKLIFRQQVCRDNEVLCEGRFVIGCVHSETIRPASIPQELRNKCSGIK